MAEYYGIGSLAEARAYLAHPVLGPRLDLCTRAVLDIEAPSLNGKRDVWASLAGALTGWF